MPLYRRKRKQFKTPRVNRIERKRELQKLAESEVDAKPPQGGEFEYYYNEEIKQWRIRAKS